MTSKAVTALELWQHRDLTRRWPRQLPVNLNAQASPTWSSPTTTRPPTTLRLQSSAMRRQHASWAERFPRDLMSWAPARPHNSRRCHGLVINQALSGTSERGRPSMKSSSKMTGVGKLAAIGGMATGVLVAWSAVSGPALAQAAKPNILLIVSDDTGYGDLGPDGGGEGRGMPTPNIDSLPKKACSSTRSTPSRVARPAAPPCRPAGSLTAAE